MVCPAVEVVLDAYLAELRAQFDVARRVEDECAARDGDAMFGEALGLFIGDRS
ncbi:MAG: hypothetical protein V9G15_13125 [Dermatophilaceae bacterium]